MRAFLVVLALVLGCNCHWYTGPRVDPDSASTLKPIDPMRVLAGLRGLEGYTIRTIDCGFYNAWAFSETNEVVLCSEVLAAGAGVARMTLLHEAGHVLFREAGVPFTGMEELAADEYAAVISVWRNRRQDVLDKAIFWANQGDDKDNGLDPHPSSARRAAHLYCLYVGSGPAPKNVWAYINYLDCRTQWRAVNSNWRKLL